MQDTGHVLVDAYGCGAEGRNRLEEQFKSGERTFRDISEDMWGSMTIPFDDELALMVKNGLEIDPGFAEFHQYCLDNGFPFNVISAGLKPVLKRVLDSFLGERVSMLLFYYWRRLFILNASCPVLVDRYHRQRCPAYRRPRLTLEAYLARRIPRRPRQGYEYARGPRAGTGGKPT